MGRMHSFLGMFAECIFYGWAQFFFLMVSHVLTLGEVMKNANIFMRPKALTIKQHDSIEMFDFPSMRKSTGFGKMLISWSFSSRLPS